MREVSCTCTAGILEALAQMGVPAHEVVYGLRVGPAWLQDRRRAIDWDTFVTFMDRVSERVGDEGLHQVGALVAHTRALRHLRLVGHWLITPRQGLQLTGWAFATVLLPVLRQRLEDLPDGRIRLTLEVPEGLRVSAPCFRVVAGHLQALPRAFDLPEAAADVRVEERRAHYTLRLPEMGLRERARRLARMAWRPSAFLRHVATQRRIRDESRAALARFQQDFHLVMERLPDGVLILRGGRIRYMNPSLLRTLGFDHVGEVVGRLVTDFLPEGERPRFSQLVVHGDGREPEPQEELRMLRKDGRAVIFEVRPVQVVTFDGERSDLLVIRDVTDRTRLQQQLMLADRMASLGTLAAGVAHEVNNPLAYTHISLQTLRRTADALREGEPLEPDQRVAIHEALSAAEQGVKRVRTIVGDLRTFSRPDDEAIRPVDVHRVIESAISMATNELRHRATLVRNYGHIPAVMANDARLGQVFLNLLVNAVQAFPTGDPRSHAIHVRTSANPPGQVTIEVEDNGPGIPPDILEHVFVPFVTSKPSGVGTGLGLSICHRIVTRLGGRIGVESTPGKGTVVRVVLPAADASVTSAPPPAMHEAPEVQRGRILVVDDEPVLLSTLSAMLSSSHEVVTADSGLHALALLRDDPSFDVILCDLMMADVNGAQVYETVQRSHPGLERRIVFMTGGAYTGSTRKFLADVDNPCLDKPFNVEEVLGLIRQYMTTAAE